MSSKALSWWETRLPTPILVLVKSCFTPIGGNLLLIPASMPQGWPSLTNQESLSEASPLLSVHLRAWVIRKCLKSLVHFCLNGPRDKTSAHGLPRSAGCTWSKLYPGRIPWSAEETVRQIVVLVSSVFIRRIGPQKDTKTFLNVVWRIIQWNNHT